MSHENRFTVRVPASTSNLGPGFDLLGLALSLELTVTATPIDEAEHRLGERAGTASSWPGTPDDVLFRAFDRVARELGQRPSRATFDVRSEIPVSRGLGSSGAACAAGLLLSNAMHDGSLDLATLTRLGIEIEGHPDNSTASLFGGCTLCVPDGDTVHVVRQPVHESLAFCVAWPEATVSTNDARGVLPVQVPFADAVENPRRLALLLEGLRTGDPVLLAAGAHDRLHVDYRLKLIEGGAAVLDAARDAGAFCATVSGSGSTLIALTDATNAQAVRDAMETTFANAHAEVTARVLEPIREAPTVTRG